MARSALQIRDARHNRDMSNQDESQDQAPEELDADGYYDEEDMANGDLDLSFLDEEADENEAPEKPTA
jgi:hypothetical protein